MKETLFPFEGYKADYDNYVVSKDKTMKNLTSVAISMSKSAGRVSYGSHIPKKPLTQESFDPNKAFFAKRNLVNGARREINLQDMASSQSRDDRMY